MELLSQKLSPDGTRRVTLGYLKPPGVNLEEVSPTYSLGYHNYPDDHTSTWVCSTEHDALGKLAEDAVAFQAMVKEVMERSKRLADDELMLKERMKESKGGVCMLYYSNEADRVAQAQLLIT